MDWSYKFKWQYDYAKAWLADKSQFQADWQPIIESLLELLRDGGFDVAKASALAQLRVKATRIGGKIATIDTGLLQAVNFVDSPGAVIDTSRKMRASVLKFLYHTYLLQTSGNKQLWLHASPKVFRHWPSYHLHAWGVSKDDIKNLLKSSNEQFNSVENRDLIAATQNSLAWCQKASIVLANAARKQGLERDSSRAIVKRWFADPACTEAALDVFIAKLIQGIKEIIATLNKGSLILTDWLPLRGASTADEIKFLNSEAFTFRGRHEGLDVVYIERSFFYPAGTNVLSGAKNWARIIIHELTHLVCGTEDVVKGQTRYAWYGIGPHAGFPGTDAIKNAESWAFFCADCAGVLTDGERSSALKII
ncbi:M35 family metallo-endopeptidase [Methylomonas montana]|uniref:M35 family metallo-endopeptidase n=1 Tax=Methylomonas montana TaxID=3058963 RepID=UPI002659A46B|nr:M35 family metallo-endopeptidase [Methylomonas montana]WKJ90885.1 M35 family metallo-endopeptidase [Methylomonas montana]